MEDGQKPWRLHPAKITSIVNRHDKSKQTFMITEICRVESRGTYSYLLMHISNSRDGQKFSKTKKKGAQKAISHIFIA